MGRPDAQIAPINVTRINECNIYLDDDDNDRARGESSLLPSYSLVSVGPDLDELGLRPLEEVVRVGDVEEVESDEWRHGRVDPLLRRVLALSQRQSLGTKNTF